MPLKPTALLIVYALLLGPMMGCTKVAQHPAATAPKRSALTLYRSSDATHSTPSPTLQCLPTYLHSDVQYDFLPPHGSLAVQGGLEILPSIRQLLDKELKWEWSKVVASQDYHPPGHISFASSHKGHEDAAFSTITVTDRYGREVEQMLWPDHCVQNSKGCEIEETVAEALKAWQATHDFHLVQKGADPLLDAYSAFATPYSPSPSSADASSSSSPLTQYLRSNGILRLVLCGIATDVCVKATARDALRAGFEVILVESAVAGVDKVNSQTALEELRSLGATVVEDPTDLKAFLER